MKRCAISKNHFWAKYFGAYSTWLLLWKLQCKFKNENEITVFSETEIIAPKTHLHSRDPRQSAEQITEIHCPVPSALTTRHWSPPSSLSRSHVAAAAAAGAGAAGAAHLAPSPDDGQPQTVGRPATLPGQHRHRRPGPSRETAQTGGPADWPDRIGTPRWYAMIQWYVQWYSIVYRRKSVLDGKGMCTGQ